MNFFFASDGGADFFVTKILYKREKKKVGKEKELKREINDKNNF